MKTYQKPETVNVNIKESNFLEIVCVSLPASGPGEGEVDESQGMAPKRTL